MLDDLAGKRTGERIQILRERKGLTRPVLAGLVGMSPSWLNGIEQAPRLPILVKLADALAVFNGEAGLHWAVLAERLAQRWPDRYAGLSADAVSAELRAAGVASVTVSAGGVKARGCRKDALEAAGAR